MADRALILSADPYEIPDEKTGEIQKLFQLWYCSDYRAPEDAGYGSKPIKMLTTPEIFKVVAEQKLPALFDMEIRSRPGKANAAALMVVGVTFVADINVFGQQVKKAA